MGKNDIQIVNGDADYELLLQSIGEALQKGRNAFVAAANSAMVRSYWEI